MWITHLCLLLALLVPSPQIGELNETVANHKFHIDKLEKVCVAGHAPCSLCCVFSNKTQCTAQICRLLDNDAVECESVEGLKVPHTLYTHTH